MRKSYNKILPFITLVILGIFFVFFFYGKVLVNPNGYIFSDSGDGIKNYFTYAHHIKHDSTYTNFEGMNYPYGENYLYTDCHPIIANLFKYLSSVAPIFETHSIGLLNLLLILSIFATFIVIYLLLLELKLNNWLSIIFSFCIAILAPQLFRLEGHLALSYSFAIPLAWLLTLKCLQRPRMLLFVLLFVNNLFWMFIHAYLGIIVISFVGSIFIVQILSDKNRKKQLRNYLWLGGSIILPVILFFFYATFTDTHLGRTNNPSGFFLYNAEIDDVLLPHGKPFRPLIDDVSNGIIKQEWEARGYVGLINTLFLVVLILLSIGSIFNKRAKNLLKTFFSNRLLNISLIASTIVLLFALAIPFKQFPFLLEVLPIFKQFRATGRFVWPFYFAFTIFAAYAFNQIIITGFDNKRRRFAGIILMVVYLGICSVEAFHYHSNISKSITKSPNLFSKTLLPDSFKKAIDSIKPDEYQAIISLPFYYQGSESYSRPRDDEAVKNSLVFAYHTGIPNVCANLTRTSVEESKKIVQVVSPNFYNKKIVGDITSRKPFLLLKTGNDFTKYEKGILDKAETIHKNDNFELLHISYEALFIDDSKKQINEFKKSLPNLIKEGSFYLSKASSVLYYNSFENSKSDTTFRGQGCFKSVKKGKNTFAEFAPNTFEKGKEYDLSIWMFNGEADALNLWFRLIVEEYDEVNKQWYSSTFFPEQTEVINDNWSLVEGVFSVNDPKNRVYIVSKGKENSKATLYVDDILIKEIGTDIYKLDKADSSLFINNHKISLR